MYALSRYGHPQHRTRADADPTEALALAPRGRSSIKAQAEADEAEVRAGRMTISRFYQLYGRAPKGV